MNRKKWNVLRAKHTQQWVVWAPYPTDVETWFPTWREAFDFAYARAAQECP